MFSRFLEIIQIFSAGSPVSSCTFLNKSEGFFMFFKSANSFRPAKILFFISFAALLVKVRAKMFLKESSSFDLMILVNTLLVRVNVFPDPAEAL